MRMQLQCLPDDRRIARIVCILGVKGVKGRSAISNGQLTIAGNKD